MKVTGTTFQSYQNLTDWLVARRASLGSSDVASVLGVSKWQSPFAVWHDKTSESKPETESDETQEWGHRLEPPIAKKLAEVLGVELHDPGEYTIYTSEKYPWLSCTPDRLVVGLIPEVVELKTAHFAAGKTWDTHVPDAYMVQVQTQMLVLGAQQGYIAVLVDGYKFAYHTIVPHLRMQRAIVNRTRDFWENYVLTKTAPPVDYTDSTRQALHDMYPSCDGGFVDIDNDTLGERYDTLCKRAAVIDKGKSLIQNQVKESMGSAEFARLPDESGFSWKESKNGRRTFRRVERVYCDDNGN